MTTYLVFISPNDEKRKSAPIDAADTQAVGILEAAGWTIVSRSADDTPVPNAPPTDLSGTPRASDAGTTSATGDLSGFDFLSDEQRASLTDAGYASPDALRGADDASLREVKGIGPSALKHLREVLGE